MANSSLVTYTNLSPHKSKRANTVQKIAIHCTAGTGTAKGTADYFARDTTKASSHYIVDGVGDVAMSVEEPYRAWTTGGTKTLNGNTGSDIDHMAIMLEVANSVAAHPWAVTDKALEKTIDLVEDIARRYGWTEVTYNPNGTGTLQAHRWYAAKACPGDYLMERFPEIAKIVTERLQGQATSHTQDTGNTLDITVGDKVDFAGNMHFVDATGLVGKRCESGTAEVTAVSLGALHPYHIIGDKKPCTAYGWVDGDTLSQL